MPIEARLLRNFKTFDFFDFKTGTAISAKTLNTLLPSKIAKPEQIYYSLKKNIDKAVQFNNYQINGFDPLTAQMIKNRHLEVAIPKGTTLQQWQQLNKARDYGQTQGVFVKITETK